MRKQEFDYIVIGAGSAGCVLAARLSEDAHVSVCLIEAGPRTDSIFIKMPAALTIPIASKTYNWNYLCGPEPQLDGRTIGQARGRGLGGSSAINGMVYVRGNPKDYDGWAKLGVEGWDFSQCLPYFKRLESFEGGNDPNRGGEGPLRVVRSRADHAYYDAFLSAGEQYGLKEAADYNSHEQEGTHVTQATIWSGVRQSTAVAYLLPAMRRPNLTVVINCHVHRVVVENGKATGVLTHKGRNVCHISARREVILSAGSIGSPQLLMLSGIGPADHLKSKGIAVAADLPGVGENLQDHVVAPLRYRAARGESIASRLGPIGQALIGLQWLLSRSGLGGTSFFEVGAFFRGRGNPAYANLQHEFLPFLADFQAANVKIGQGFQYFVSQMRPHSRGWVRLRSADPDDHPEIVFNYLADDRDAHEMLDGIELTREMAQQTAWQTMGASELEPGSAVQTRDDLRAWFKSVANTEHHPVGTCSMGSDDFAVTDSQGRVRGVAGLRVVDGSILPAIPTANVNAPIIMVAEKIADQIAGNPILKPQQLITNPKAFVCSSNI